jgi:LysM repeat protein
MHWEKKICIRITLRRIVGTLVMASVVANLVIVGAVLGAVSPSITPTITALLTTPAWTNSPFAFPSTASEVSTFTPTVTQTLTFTPTETQTSTIQPSSTACVKRLDWPIYYVERGDTLYRIGVASGSTVLELKLANCLESDRIVAGQPLHVPRLPVTYTPTDMPTVFEIAEGMSCDGIYFIAFRVNAYDPDGTVSITVLVYSNQNTLLTEVPMEPRQTGYIGWISLPEQPEPPYTALDISYYQFRAVDSFQNVTFSSTYSQRSKSCIVTPPTLETAPGQIG